MLWHSDLETLAQITHDRQVEMLALAERERQLKQSLPGRQPKQGAWQRLSRSLRNGLQQGGRPDPSSTHPSLQQS